jgi:alcohol/geraniol dehydrogenase (NADP+)
VAALTVTGFAAMAVGEPLQPFAYESPELGEHDVRVSVSHCGLCFTDVHGIDDFFEISTFPFVPGHEIVGIVSAAGPAVSELEVGDRVGIGWQGRSCMRCEWCLQGQEQLCVDIENSATWKPFGGFASSVVVDSRFAYRLPDAMPPEVAAVLMCAGITVYTPLRRYATGPSPQIGIVGVGGLGHLAIQFAHALGCEITAISSSPAKDEEARAFGADHFVLAERAGLRQIFDRLDMVLCTVHGAPAGELTWERLVLTLRRNGRLVLVGFPQVTLDPQELIVHQISITGSVLGSRAAMPEMLQFAQAHGIVPAVELMPMSAVNEAILRLKENRVRYRVVLVNDTGAATA